jgi:molecular chaperone GrpE
MKDTQENVQTEQAAATGAKTEQAPTNAAEPPPGADMEQLQKQAAKAAEHWDRLLRTTADFDNYKKRAAREKQEAVKFANEALLEKLIPVLDSFEMALNATKSADGEASRALEKGVELVFVQLKQVLKEAGLEEVEATGAAFDPNLHEAISAQESADVPEGNVLHQLRKGYKLRDRLLRPASVVVAKPPGGKT